MVLSTPRMAVISPHGQFELREPTPGITSPSFTTLLPTAGGEFTKLATSVSGQVSHWGRSARPTSKKIKCTISPSPLFLSSFSGRPVLHDDGVCRLLTPPVSALFTPAGHSHRRQLQHGSALGHISSTHLYTVWSAARYAVGAALALWFLEGNDMFPATSFLRRQNSS
jgi:hypothetical protein